MPRPVPRGLLGIVEPRDAVAAFLRRDLLLPSFNWHDVWQQEHLRGFAVAGVMRHDILQLLYDEIGVAVQTGGLEKGFVKAAAQRLAEKGFWGDVQVEDPATGEQRTTRFNDNRLRLIFDTNLGVSYAAGKAERYERTKKYLPYLRYVTRRDEHVRESHRAWEGVTLPYDDPWWTLHKPIKAWRCRCDVAQLSERQMQRLLGAGQIVTVPPADTMVPRLDLRTGETVQLPRGVDPAFAYDIGKRPLRGVVPPPLLADPFDRTTRSTPTLDAARAAPPPRTVGASVLLPEGVDKLEAVRRFLAEFGAAFDKPVGFTDPLGETLVIGDELFKSNAGKWKVRRGRERFMLLLAQTIQEPDEIWQGPLLHEIKGIEVRRRRYFARWRIEGSDTPAVAVFETGPDGWLGITTYQAENQAAVDAVIADARVGTLVWRREGGP